MLKYSLLLVWMLAATAGFSQYTWKQVKDKDGIKVFTSDLANSKFKAIKVECTLNGTYTKLVHELTNVEHLSDWVYNCKKTQMIKKISDYDFIYYSETHLPWPLSNRDVTLHFRVKTDSVPKFLTITGTNENGVYPEIPAKVRVPHYKATWKVTMPTPGTIHVVYIVEVDPGGSIPAWLSNMFADKGPYETFVNLGKRMMSR